MRRVAMRWRALAVAAAVGLLVLGTASPALAKGADLATITGPGLSQPIVVGGMGEPGSGEVLGQLSEDSGLFQAMFGSSDGPGLQPSAPPGALGPKYDLVYRVPGGDIGTTTVHQDLYPVAAGGPVTFTAPGQAALGMMTSGGWYRGPAGFAQILATLGVPGAGSAPPSVAPPSSPAVAAAPVAAGADAAGTPWLAISGGVLAALVILGAAVVVLLRRRRAVPQH